MDILVLWCMSVYLLILGLSEHLWFSIWKVLQVHPEQKLKKKKNIADCDLSSPANELNAFDLFMNEDGITMSKVF